MEEKFFQLSTYSEPQWDALNLELGSVGSLSSTVPQRVVACVDELMHSATRGTYLLTQDEADALKNDPRVEWINIDYKSYPEYRIPAEELYCTVPTINRWTSSPKATRKITEYGTLAATGEVNRMGYGVLRHRQFAEYWKQNNTAPTTKVPTNVSGVYGTGKHVDVIVADDGGGWHGHPEFYNDPIRTNNIKELVEKPNGYAGGNRLPGSGKCDLLDLVLDGPYYIDPDWFDASPETRLITRWDGTRVPAEGVARAWWKDASRRSPAFASIGTVAIPDDYSRAQNNGNNIARAQYGDHATPCCALAFGRTQGWAYNSNKWAFNLLSHSQNFFEQGFDLVKIFHKNKPINPLYGTRDPTVMSNSWGFRDRASKMPRSDSPNYYTHRSTAAVQYKKFDDNLWLSHMGETGDGGRWKSEMKPNSLTAALSELIQAGVIFVVAAGNSNQKQVLPGHPDYNNYIAKSPTHSLLESSFTEFDIPVYGTTNRRGFPQQGGAYIKNGERVYPAINIGCLNDTFLEGKENKVNYSDRGNGVDAYFSGHLVLAANNSREQGKSKGIFGEPERLVVGNRADTYADYGGGDSYTLPATDVAFNGTSAACPGAAGFIACVLEYNRAWGWQDVKNWIAALTPQDPGDFYYGVESTTPDDKNWENYESLEGGTPRVLYQLAEYYNDNLAGPIAGFSRKPFTLEEGASGRFNVMSGEINNGTTLYWTILHDTTTDADFVSTSGSFTITNDRGLFDVNTTADKATEGTQNFRIQLRLDSTSGTVIGTSDLVPITDTSIGVGGDVQSYAVSGYSEIINEGGKTTVVVTTTNVPNGTTLNWAINHVSTTAADFTAQSGSFTVNSNTGSFVITTKVT